MRVKIKYLLVCMLLISLFSCVDVKRSNTKKGNNMYTDAVPRNHLSIGNFVEKIDLSKLCNPVKLLIFFSIDASGKTHDPMFRPIAKEEKCTPDSLYLEEMKLIFKEEVPIWVFPSDDTSKMIRVSIPVVFD